MPENATTVAFSGMGRLKGSRLLTRVVSWVESAHTRRAVGSRPPTRGVSWVTSADRGGDDAADGHAAVLDPPQTDSGAATCRNGACLYILGDI